MPAVPLFKSHSYGWINCPLFKCKCLQKEKHGSNFQNPVPLGKLNSFLRIVLDKWQEVEGKK